VLLTAWAKKPTWCHNIGPCYQRLCSLLQLQLVADLGSLQLSNRIAWLGASGRVPAPLLKDPAAVLLDTSTLTMRGLSAKVDADGHTGGNIIREYDEGTKVSGRDWFNQSLQYSSNQMRHSRADCYAKAHTFQRNCSSGRCVRRAIAGDSLRLG